MAQKQIQKIQNNRNLENINQIFEKFNRNYFRNHSKKELHYILFEIFLHPKSIKLITPGYGELEKFLWNEMKENRELSKLVEYIWNEKTTLEITLTKKNQENIRIISNGMRLERQILRTLWFKDQDHHQKWSKELELLAQIEKENQQKKKQKKHENRFKILETEEIEILKDLEYSGEKVIFDKHKNLQIMIPKPEQWLRKIDNQMYLNLMGKQNQKLINEVEQDQERRNNILSKIKCLNNDEFKTIEQTLKYLLNQKNS